MLNGCAKAEGLGDDHDKAAFGVIQTCSNSNESTLAFYDEQLNEIAELKIPFASLNNFFYDPIYANDRLYAIPQGMAYAKNENAVLEINPLTFEVRRFTIRQPAMNSLAVGSEALFTCNTLNGSSFINRYSLESGNVQSLEVEGTYITYLFATEDKLYSFSSPLIEERLLIDVYDHDLNHLQTIETSIHDPGVYRAATYGGSLYFTTLADQTRSVSEIWKLDPREMTIEGIEVNESRPFGIRIEEDTLYTLHLDPITRSGSSAFTSASVEGTIKQQARVDDPIYQFIVCGDSLYAIDRQAVYRYRADTFELIGKEEIVSAGSAGSYLSGIFEIAR